MIYPQQGRPATVVTDGPVQDSIDIVEGEATGRAVFLGTLVGVARTVIVDASTPTFLTMGLAILPLIGGALFGGGVGHDSPPFARDGGKPGW